MVKSSTRILDKINVLDKWIDELSEIIPKDYLEYEKNNVLLAATERYIERIVEEMILISNIILKEKGIVDRKKCFSKLEEIDVISKDLSIKLEQIKGMRNIMIHRYEDFDPEIFLLSIKNILKDSKEFKKSIYLQCIEEKL